MTYAVGWRYKDQCHSLVAETERDLETNSILWKAIQQWNELAKAQDEEEWDEGPALFEEAPKKKSEKIYIYARNARRFDSIAAIQAILANSEDVPTDQLESNGKFISFTYKDHFFAIPA